MKGNRNNREAKADTDGLSSVSLLLNYEGQGGGDSGSAGLDFVARSGSSNSFQKLHLKFIIWNDR